MRPALAHDLRPAMLRVELTPETTTGAADEAPGLRVELHLRLPPQIDSALLAPLAPTLTPCTLTPTDINFNNFNFDSNSNSPGPSQEPWVRRWRGRCPALPETAPLTLELAGLGRGLDVVVDLRRPGLAPATTVLDHNATTWEFFSGGDSDNKNKDKNKDKNKTPAPINYLGLGITHIFGGADHLLFVVGLVLLVLPPRRPRDGAPTGLAAAALAVIAPLTAFTVAHSLTLAAASLGVVRLAVAPVEACIALSIVLLARELIVPARASSARAPVAFAFACGLLHGLGFAGALAEIGLPQGSLVAALLFFNLGVEVGQVAIAGLVIVALAITAAWVPPPSRARLRYLAALAIGGIACAWTLERGLAIIG